MIIAAMSTVLTDEKREREKEGGGRGCTLNFFEIITSFPPVNVRDVVKRKRKRHDVIYRYHGDEPRLAKIRTYTL